MTQDPDSVDNFEDLLNLTADETSEDEKAAEPVAEKPAKAPARRTTRTTAAEKKAPEKPAKDPAKKPAARTESADDARIRDLEAQLAQPLPEFSPEDAADDEEVLAKKARIKDLEDQLAKRNALIAESSDPTYEKASGGDTILVHVREDGFIALGEVWYRGQELEFKRGGLAFQQTMNTNGESWVDLAGNEGAQLDRWGKYYLGSGPFVPRKGEKFDDALSAQDARRGRAVPIRRF